MNRKSSRTRCLLRVVEFSKNGFTTSESSWTSCLLHVVEFRQSASGLVQSECRYEW